MFMARCSKGHTNQVLGDAPHPFGKVRRCTEMINENGATCGLELSWETPIHPAHAVPQITDVRTF